MDSLPAFVISPSVYPRRVQQLACVLAAFGVLMCGLAWWWQGILIAWLRWLGLRNQANRATAITQLGCERGKWWIVLGHQRREVTLVKEQLVLPWLVVLHLQLDAKQIDLALWLDSAAADDLRRLRVFLRHAQ